MLRYLLADLLKRPRRDRQVQCAPADIALLIEFLATFPQARQRRHNRCRSRFIQSGFFWEKPRTLPDQTRVGGGGDRTVDRVRVREHAEQKEKASSKARSGPGPHGQGLGQGRG